MVDSRIVSYVKFHVSFVRPVLHLVAQAKDNPEFQNFLLDTRTGMPLDSRSICVTSSSWVNSVDSEIYSTPMDVRACYATYMIRKHVKNVLEKDENPDSNFRHLSEQQFSDMLSSVMSTSVDQLCRVFAAATYNTFADQVAKVLGIFALAYNAENNE